MHWIVIYQVDSVIHLLNNLALKNSVFLFLGISFFRYTDVFVLCVRGVQLKWYITENISGNIEAVFNLAPEKHITKETK